MSSIGTRSAVTVATVFTDSATQTVKPFQEKTLKDSLYLFCYYCNESVRYLSLTVKLQSNHFMARAATILIEENNKST
jgi:hypothetical protein